MRLRNCDCLSGLGSGLLSRTVEPTGWTAARAQPSEPVPAPAPSTPTPVPTPAPPPIVRTVYVDREVPVPSEPTKRITFDRYVPTVLDVSQDMVQPSESIEYTTEAKSAPSVAAPYTDAPPAMVQTTAAPSPTESSFPWWLVALAGGAILLIQEK